MAELYCAMCKTNKDENDFTPYNRNPVLKDRQGRVTICKDCCNRFVEERDNSLDSLKEILRLVDIPYIDSFGKSALTNYKKKIKSTNLVVKTNLATGKESKSKESIKLQTTIYAIYCARIGFIPKEYINFSFSDGIRDNEEIQAEIRPVSDVEKKIMQAENYLTKMFSEDVYKNSEKLVKAVKLKLEEFALHKQDNSQRQAKFKFRQNLLTLIDNGVLERDLFTFIEDKRGSNNNPTDKALDKKESKKDDVSVSKIEIPVDFNLESMEEKWGYGYVDVEYVLFDKKYTQLKRSYEIKTASHDEFLKHACIASVKASMATARGDVKEAKDWMTIFKDVTTAGKLQPQQMSKADLSGGLNNFSEFYKSIESAKKIIDILPEFKKQPRDDADFVIYCNINYLRRLKGLPDCKYEDIWKFYEEIAKANMNELDDDYVNDFINEDSEDEGVDE